MATWLEKLRNSANILAGVGAGAVGLSSLAGLPQDDYY